MKKILQVLGVYDKEVLYRKVGYILSYYKDELKLSELFFDTCLFKSKSIKWEYLVNNDKDNLLFDSKWGLYVYINLYNIDDKVRNQDV